jgi:copper oxidase (laccase) domain-containing protein
MVSKVHFFSSQVNRIEMNLFPSPLLEDMNVNESTSLCNTTNKAVRWDPRCKVRFIGILDEEEKINAWYQQDDIQSFKEECIKQLVNQHGIESMETIDKVSCRGLEQSLSKRRNLERQKRRQQGNTTKKAVRWYPRCNVRFIGIPDEEEKMNTWYQQDDILSFKEELGCIKQLVNKHGIESVEAMDKVSCRGLEQFFSGRRNLERQKKRQQALGIVLATQRSQRHSGFNKPEDIAEYYRIISTQCQLEANICAMTYFEEN